MVVTFWKVEELHENARGNAQWVISEAFENITDAEWFQRSRWEEYSFIRESLIIEYVTRTHPVRVHGPVLNR